MASSENFDLIIRARDESSSAIAGVQQRMGGLGQETASATSKLQSMTTASVVVAQSVRGMMGAMLGVTGVMGLASVAVVSIVGHFSDKINATKRLNEALDLNAKALATVAQGMDYFGRLARENIALHDEMTVKLIAETEAKIRYADAGAKELGFWGKLIAIMTSIPGHTIADEFKDLTSPARAAAIATLTGELNKLKQSLSGIGRLGETGPMSSRAQHDDEVATAALYARAKALKIVLQLEQERGRNLHPVYGGVDVSKVPNMSGESTWAKYHADEIKKMAAEARAAEAAERQLQSVVLSGTSSMASGIVSGLMGARVDLAGIFKGIAADFAKFFIEDALKAILMSFIPGLKLVLAIFDTREGDAFAASQGRDFARYFLQGVTGGLSGGMALAAFSGPSIAASTRSGSFGGGTTVVVNIQGDIVGDELFVRKRMIPQIERAAEMNATRIALAR